MPNHWHVAIQPRGDGELARYFGWITNTHVKRYRQHYQTMGEGHVYQGRYKSFPVEDDRHALVMLRYVEANALRGGLVTRAEMWPWCGAAPTVLQSGLLNEWPIERPANWLEIVNEPQPESEMQALRASLKRDYPFGTAQWVLATAKGLGFSIRPKGRPRKAPSVTEGSFET
jgi:putative transposase